MTSEKTTEAYNGRKISQCGDINLAAALMAVGIPLDPGCPVTVINTEIHRDPYGSYGLCQCSDDGKESTELLMAAWNGTKSIAPDHPFSQICAFMRARPRGIQRSSDLLAFAVDYLQGRGFKLAGLRAIEDIPRYIKAVAENEASYILAYVANRELCFVLYNQASRRVHMKEGEGKDARHAVLDSKLPAWKRREFLSRLQN